MALTSKDINSLYITLFNRIPEGNGQQYWLNEANTQNLDLKTIALIMLQTDASKEFFKGKEKNEDFVNHIYSNLLGKDKTSDPDGVAYWSDLLNNAMSKGEVVVELLKAAEYNKYTDPEAIKAQNLYLNKLKAADVGAKAIKDIASSGTLEEKIAAFTNVLKNITDKSTAADIAINIKTQAILNNVAIVPNKEFARIISDTFEGVTSSAIERILDDLVANGFTKFNQISDKDGFLKLFDDSKNLVKAEGVDYTLYKGDDGKFYKDENNKKTLAEISIDKLKISDVKLDSGEIYTFKKPEVKKEDVIKGYNLENLVKDSKDGDMLMTGKAFVLFADKSVVKEILADIETIVGVNYTGKLGSIQVAQNVVFRILDTAENLQKVGAAEVLILLKDNIKSIDIAKQDSSLTLSLAQFKNIKDKFTDLSDKTGALKSFPSLKNQLAAKEKVIIKDSASDIQKVAGDLNEFAHIKSADGIDLIDTDNTLKLSLSQYSLIGDKFLDPNDSLNVADVTGAVVAGATKDIFSLSKDVSNLTISNFSDSDKIGFKNLGVTSVSSANFGISSSASLSVGNGNIYGVNLDINISKKDYGGADFQELFAAGGAAFKNSTIGDQTNAVVAVAGKDITQLYRIKADGDNSLSENEVSLIGIISSSKDTGVVLNDKNVVIDDNL